MMLQTSPRFFQPIGLDRSKHVNATSSSMPITPTISWWTVVPMEALLVQICESSTNRKINISGIDNHEVTGLDVVTAATLLNTSLGKVIGIFNEYAYLGQGSSIHSSGQLEWFKTLVDEKSIKVGGTQLITTLDGYSVPLLIRDGLAYATSLGRPTDQDMDTYPHVFFTSPDEWDPSVLDHDPPHFDGLDPSQVSDQPFGDPMFDAYGDFNERIIANLNILLDAPPGDC